MRSPDNKPQDNNDKKQPQLTEQDKKTLRLIRSVFLIKKPREKPVAFYKS